MKRKYSPHFLAYIIFLLVPTIAVYGQNPSKKESGYDASIPKPTKQGIKYGEHKRNVIDLWLAPSEKPTPLVLVIHGGGWRGGSKERLHRFADTSLLLKSGISVAAINYRLLSDSLDTSPPVKAPLYDAARALQFIRSKSNEWNINKDRIGLAGGSAGACSSLWLVYHDDLAVPESVDPIARESTKPFCAAVIRAQTTLDPKLIQSWIPNCYYGAHAFGMSNKDFEQFLAKREDLLSFINEYSPYSHVSANDPPVYILYQNPPALGKKQKDPVHSANFGIMLQKRCHKLNVPCEIMFPGVTGVRHKTTTEYLLENLKH